MKKTSAMLLICLACLLMMAAGCTGSSGTVPGTTPASSGPWSGTWNTEGTTTIASQTFGVLTLTQAGSSVTGTFRNDDGSSGTISGTATGNQLSGTWAAQYPGGSDNGQFVFTFSDNRNSFTGTWTSASDTAHSLSNSPESWNGTR